MRVLAPAAQLVSEVAQHNFADRPGDVADPECRQRGDGRDRGVPRGEEDVVEHERGGRAVDEEVVVLEGAAEEGEND